MTNEPTEHPKRRSKWLWGAAAALAGGAMIWGMWPSRPTALGTDISSHISTPAALYLSLNGRVIVNGSIRGRAEGGGATYGSRWGDALNWDLAWYDILAERSYRLKFTISASELSTFGEDGSHATIRIFAGPGADVLATTTDPEVARLIGLRQTDNLPTIEEVPDIALRELCAEPLAADDPFTLRMKKFIASFKQVSNSEDFHLQNNLKARERYLQNNKTPIPRCPDVGKNQ